MRHPHARIPAVEQFLTQTAGPVLSLHATALLQHRHDTVNEVRKAAGQGRVGQIESVDACRYPVFQLVGNLLGRTDQHGASPTDTDIIGDIAHGPHATRVADREAV